MILRTLNYPAFVLDEITWRMRQFRSRIVQTITKRIYCRATIQEVQNSSSMEPSVSSSPSLSGLQGIRMGIAAPLISPEEMQQCVFMSVEEETVVDTIFLVSVIVEYMRRYSLCMLLCPKTLEFPFL